MLTPVTKTRQAVMMLGLVAMVFAMAPKASANSIVINSSSAVTLLDSGIQDGDFSSVFTSANFTSAQTGRNASVLSSTPFYAGTLSSGPGAVWIDTNSNAGTQNGTGDTALYAVSFTLPTNFSAASFTLNYAVDNTLGGTNAGIFINGTALANSAGTCSLCSTNYSQQNTYTDSNITSLLHSGTNWLYIDGVNEGRQGGLIFSADINISTAPEPSSALLLGIGVLGLALIAARRKRLAAV